MLAFLVRIGFTFLKSEVAEDLLVYGAKKILSRPDTSIKQKMAEDIIKSINKSVGNGINVVL